MQFLLEIWMQKSLLLIPLGSGTHFTQDVQRYSPMKLAFFSGQGHHEAAEKEKIRVLKCAKLVLLIRKGLSIKSTIFIPKKTENLSIFINQLIINCMKMIG